MRGTPVSEEPMNKAIKRVQIRAEPYPNGHQTSACSRQICLFLCKNVFIQYTHYSGQFIRISFPCRLQFGIKCQYLIHLHLKCKTVWPDGINIHDITNNFKYDNYYVCIWMSSLNHS